MFNVNAKPVFTHPVKIKVPADGGYDEQTCKATFRALRDDEVATFDLATSAGSAEFLRAVIVKLDDLADGDKPAAYSEALRDQLLQWQFVRAGLARAYFEGMVGAATGN